MFWKKYVVSGFCCPNSPLQAEIRFTHIPDHDSCRPRANFCIYYFQGVVWLDMAHVSMEKTKTENARPQNNESHHNISIKTYRTGLNLYHTFQSYLMIPLFYLSGASVEDSQHLLFENMSCVFLENHSCSSHIQPHHPLEVVDTEVSTRSTRFVVLTCCETNFSL